MHHRESVNPTIDRAWLHSLPNDKILDSTKLKAFADKKINVTELGIPLYDTRHVGNGEVLVSSVFSFSHIVCKKPVSFFNLDEHWNCVVGYNSRFFLNLPFGRHLDVGL